MKRSSQIAILAAGGAALLWLGYLAGHARQSSVPEPAVRAAQPATPERRVLYWYDPMKPEVHFDHPGQSPFMDMKLVPKYADEETAGAAVPGYAPVTIPPGRLQQIGVTTEAAARRSISGTVTTNGTVAEDESLRFDVNVKFAGWIRKLRVERTGDRVRRGDPLLTVYSPDLVATERELLLALENERRLAASSGNAEAARDAARLTAASRDRLRLWDVPDAEIERIARTGEVRTEIPIVSPATGTVLVKNAVEGMAISPGMNLYSIADLSRIWILADLYAPEIPVVRRGDAADISLSSVPGRRLEGRVDFLYPTVNAETRTARVRIVVNNPSGEIRPGMYATVAIHGAPREALAVPRTAVIETGKRSIAFVETSPGRFEPRELEVGDRTPDFVEVRAGLRAGERVVTSADFLIDSESRIGAVGTPPPGAAGQPQQPPPETPPRSPEERP
jgi:membrane fusion protein, copper/silver efflux system